MPNRHLSKDGEIHLWLARFSEFPPRHNCGDPDMVETEPPLTSKLPSIDRFSGADSRRAFILRLLSAYSGIQPERLRLGRGKYGRPQITSPCEIDLAFNSSHKHEWAVCVVGKDGRLGVDIEYLDIDFDLEPLARRCLSKQGYSHFVGRDIGERTSMFFAAWTQKEACLKAKGERLAYGLQRISVPSETEPRLMLNTWRRHGDWYFYTCAPWERYLVSITTDTPVSRVQTRWWFRS